MRGEDHRRPLRDLIDLLHCDRALVLKGLDHIRIVDDLVLDVDRRAKALQRQVYHVDGPDHARAKAARHPKIHLHGPRLQAGSMRYFRTWPVPMTVHL